MASYRGSLWHSRILLPGLHTFRTFTAVLSRIAVCSFRRESGTCTPPFFRTSTGHRVEGRNPWHLQCSHNQLHVGTQFRRLVRSLSLRPSWLLASWADQTEPRLSLPQAFTSGLPALKSPQGLPDITTAPNGELRRQDFHLQVQQLVSLRSLQWVPWASVPHLPRYYAPLRLPPCPSQGASLVARSLIPCPLRCVRGVPHGLMIWSKSPDHARAFGHPVPHSGNVTRRHVALPSSRVSPVKPCPALRPRWCPAHSPKRAQDCCLPATEHRRLTTTLSISGLHHAA
jgi:hypothetical protein